MSRFVGNDTLFVAGLTRKCVENADQTDTNVQSERHRNCKIMKYRLAKSHAKKRGSKGRFPMQTATS